MTPRFAIYFSFFLVWYQAGWIVASYAFLLFLISIEVKREVVWAKKK